MTDTARPDPPVLSRRDVTAELDLIHVDELAGEAGERVAGYALLKARGDEITGLDLLARIRACRIAMSAAESLVESEVARQMHSDVVVIDGRLTATRRKGKDRKSWDHEALIRDVLHSASVNRETGEVVDIPADVYAIIATLIRTGHIDYWRVGQMKALGLDPDEYCESTPGRWSVSIDEVE